jgi:hypothetical protein
MKKLSESQKNYMESNWQDHIRILSQPNNVYYRAANSFQRIFDEITPDIELQKRLSASIMDASYRDRDANGYPKYSKDIWFACGAMWGVEEEMRVYVERYWDRHVKDSERHLSGHTNQIIKCALCGGETFMNDPAWPNHHQCLYRFYEEMSQLGVILVKAAEIGAGFMWKPTTSLQKTIDRKIDEAHRYFIQTIDDDLAILLGTASAVYEYVPQNIAIEKSLYLTGIIFEELMKNKYGQEPPADKTSVSKLKELAECLKSKTITKEITQFVDRLEKQLDSYK